MAVFDKYRLLFSEDRTSGQYAQDPSKVRRLVNLIPSRSGKLQRKAFSPPFISTNPLIGGLPAWFSGITAHDFYVAGVKSRQYIIKVTNNVSTFLYKYDNAGGITLLPLGAREPPHNSPNGWVGDPILVYYEGLLFISDGDSNANPNPNLNGNWTVYDGTDTWKGGLDIPGAVAIQGSAAGSVTHEIYAEYAVTEFDSIRNHESPPGARARFVPSPPGDYDVTIDMPAAIVNVAPGSGSDWTAGYPDKWRIYRSHIDGSGRLFRIAEIPIASTDYVDAIPFWGETVTTAMTPFEPPYLNHKPKPSSVAAIMHNRIAMRDEDRLNRIWITGFAEVIRQDPASVVPQETVPGVRDADAQLENRRVSANFVELPDESFEVVSMLWWQEGLMLGSEQSVQFLWGHKPEDFRPANTSTYGFGLFGRNSFLLTTHGLVMFTDDRKIVLDPAVQRGRASSGERTAQVVDLGWDQQARWDSVDKAFANRFQMVHFQYGTERDWLVVAYTTQVDGLAHLVVFDFDTGSWIDFDDVEATSVSIIGEVEGYRFLLAGNSNADRQMKVVTDFDATASSPYQEAEARMGMPATGSVVNPANVLQTGLLDFGNPDKWKVFRKLSFFEEGGLTVVVKVWLDPLDVDNLVPGDAILLTLAQLESNEWQGWIWKYKKRIVAEFTIAASNEPGSLSGIEFSHELKAAFGV